MTAETHAQLNLNGIIFSQESWKGDCSKGRYSTVKLYAQDIDEMHSRSEEDQPSVDVAKIDVDPDHLTLEVELRDLILRVIKVADFETEQDFLPIGMGSLHVMTLVRLLKKVVVGIPLENITSALVYISPNLASFIMAVDAMVPGTNRTQAKTREEEMLEVLDCFTSQLPISLATS